MLVNSWNFLLRRGNKRRLFQHILSQRMDKINGSISNGFCKTLTTGEDEWKIVEETFKLIVEKLTPEAQKNSKMIEFKTPAEMRKMIDFKLATEPAKSRQYLLELCGNIVDYSIKTGHPMFRNPFYGGCDPFGLAASVLVDALNTNSYTFEVAPVFQMIEREVIDSLIGLCGYSDGDGIFCPGGSIANMYGVSLARHQSDESVKQKGMRQDSEKMLIFTSEQAHYSIIKGAVFMGFGTDSIVKIKCDRLGAMDPADLESQLQKAMDLNKRPLMVWSTSGTTVLNAMDPIDKISSICQKYKIWLHVDACIGGCFLLSDKYRHLMDGIEKSDSMTWNWHKILGAPLQTSIFLTKHKNVLEAAHSAKASYLFGANRYYDTSFDVGDKAITCGRKADAVKVWLMWKARGVEGLGGEVEEAIEVLNYIWRRMKQSPRFQLILPEPQGLSICFRMVPAGLQPDAKELDGVCLSLKKRMVEDGRLMIACMPDPVSQVHFFRWTMVCHPPFTTQDADRLLDILIQLTDQI